MRPRAIGVAVTVAAAAAVFAPAAMGAWSPPYALIADPDHGDPRLVSDIGGDSLFVYDTFSRGSVRLVARTRQAGGPWSPLRDLWAKRGENAIPLVDPPQTSARGALVTWTVDRDFGSTDWVAVYRPRRGFGRSQPLVDDDAARRRQLRPAMTALGPGGHGAALYYDRRGMTVRPLRARAMRFGPPVRLPARGGEEPDRAFPRVAVGPTGAVAGAWAVERNGRCRLQVATAPAPRGPWTTRELPARAACDAAPALAVNRGGQAVVVWRAGRRGIFASAGSAANGFARPRRLSDDGTRYRVGLDDDGRATVVFGAPVGNSRSVFAATRPAGGSFEPAVQLGVVGRQLPDLQVNRAGDTAIRWRGAKQDWIVSRARESESFSAPDRLAPHSVGFRPSQFVLDEEGFVVGVWGENGITGAVWRAGERVGERTVLWSGGTCDPARVATSRAGHVLVGWIDDCGFDSEPASMWVAERAPGGAIEPPRAISEPRELNACWPELAIDSAGWGTAMWCDGNSVHFASDRLP